MLAAARTSRVSIPSRPKILDLHVLCEDEPPKALHKELCHTLVHIEENLLTKIEDVPIGHDSALWREKQCVAPSPGLRTSMSLVSKS